EFRRVLFRSRDQVVILAVPARDCGSGRQRGAAPGTTGVDDAAAGARAHPGTEAMLLVTATVVRLGRALAHRCSSIMGTDVPLAVGCRSAARTGVRAHPLVRGGCRGGRSETGGRSAVDPGTPSGRRAALTAGF